MESRPSRTDLVGCTEDVCVILHEPSHSGQTAQCSAGFVSVQNTEFGHPQGQFLVTSLSGVEDQTMSGTVHGLDGELFLVDRHAEHVIGVVLPMSGSLPELRVVDVGRANLGVTSLVVFALSKWIISHLPMVCRSWYL
jgi:hypothetical protein